MPETITVHDDIPIKTVDSAAEVLGPPKDEVPAWKKALKALWTVFWVGFVGYLTQFLTDHPAQVAAFIVALVPAGLKAWAGIVVGSGISSLAAWLKKRKNDSASAEKRDALATVPPPDLTKWYSKAA